MTESVNQTELLRAVCAALRPQLIGAPVFFGSHRSRFVAHFRI